LIDEIRFKVKS